MLLKGFNTNDKFHQRIQSQDYLKISIYYDNTLKLIKNKIYIFKILGFTLKLIEFYFSNILFKVNILRTIFLDYVGMIKLTIFK